MTSTADKDDRHEHEHEHRERAPFAVNETVLARDGALLFEARVRAVAAAAATAEGADGANDDGGGGRASSRSPPQARRYLVHYIGWKNSWDEYVDESRVCEKTPENVERARQMLREFRVQQRAGAAATRRRASAKRRGRGDGDGDGDAVAADVENVDGDGEVEVAEERDDADDDDDGEEAEAGEDNDGGGGRHTAAANTRKKRRRSGKSALHADADADADQFDVNAAFDLALPLKRLLVDDYRAVACEQHLVPLPREHTIAAILQAWMRSKSRPRGGEKVERELAEGLKEYFNVSVGRVLLYNVERAQYRRLVVNRGERPSDVYGGEHLLRLLVKLPWYLQQTPMRASMMRAVAERAADLGRFLVKHARVYFSERGENHDGDGGAHALAK